MESRPDSLLNNTARMYYCAQSERKSVAGIDQRQQCLNGELNIPLNSSNQSITRRGPPTLGPSATLRKADACEKRATTDIEASGNFINHKRRTVERSIWSPQATTRAVNLKNSAGEYADSAHLLGPRKPSLHSSNNQQEFTDIGQPEDESPITIVDPLQNKA